MGDLSFFDFNLNVIVPLDDVLRIQQRHNTSDIQKVEYLNLDMIIFRLHHISMFLD